MQFGLHFVLSHYVITGSSKSRRKRSWHEVDVGHKNQNSYYPPFPSPPLPSPPRPLFELTKIIAVRARRGDTRRKREPFFLSSLSFYSCPRGMKFCTRSRRFWLDLSPVRQRQMIIHQYRKTWLSLFLHFFTIKHNHDINFICKQQSAV